MNKTLLLVLLCSMLYYNNIRAQSPAASAWCAANEYHQNKYQTNPIYQQLFDQNQQLIYNKVADELHHPNNTRAVHVVPMVVHIVSPPGTPIGTGNNLTDQQVQDGLQLLNDAFANTGSFATPSGVDVEIQFCLAQRDPDGQLTNGITRHYSPVVAQADCGGAAFNYGDENQLFTLSNWDCCQYVNVYLVTNITGAGYGCSVAGYATVASSCGFMVQESQYWTNISGTQVSAHEMGHFFGLWHTFEGGCTNTGNCLADGDAICDTPPDNETFNACNANTCNTDTPDLPDDTQNYMDYGACNPWHFTVGQKARMIATLETTQACLLNSMGCLSPCPAPLTANLLADATNIVVGTSVNFTALATNASSYAYNIDAQAPFANTLNASHTFNSVGAYWVKFKAISNNPLCADAIDSVQITVSCNANALFNASSTAINEGNTIVFTNSSIGATNYQWTVDNVPVGTNPNYTQQFNTAGNYYVCLTASNAICSDIHCQIIGVAPVGAPIGCTGNTFQKHYGGNAEDIAQSVFTDTDGGYVLAGYTKSFGAGDNNGLLFKTSANGTVIWTKKIGIAGYNEQLYDVKKTSDGGYVAVGTSYPGTLALCYGNTEQSGFIWRLDNNANTLWITKINGNTTNGETAYKVIETADGGFAFVGATDYGCSIVDAMAGKIDANGNLVWCKRWANANGSTDVNVNLTEDANNNIAIVGYTRSYHGDNSFDNYHNICVTKVDGNNGNLIWSSEYYGQNNIAGSNDFSPAIKLLPNGNYLLAATQQPLANWSSTAGPASSTIFELNALNGDIAFQKNFVFQGSSQASMSDVLFNTNNQQYAYTFNDVTNITPLIVDGTLGVGTASNIGATLNNTNLGFGSVYALAKVANDGYIITGYQTVSGQRDIYLGRVNNDLLTPGCENIPLEIIEPNRLLVKTTADWTFTDLTNYIHPNQTMTIQAIDLAETGELCSTNCEEVCDNGIDDNNNGLVDENCPCPTLVLTNDTTACPNQPIQIEANFGFDTYQWTPSTGLSDPNIRNPIATPTSPINYTVVATKLSSNKVVNGDFSLGNVAFTSGQTYSSTYSPCNYYVGTPWFGSLFPECVDHTPSADNFFMHVDGCTTSATMLWQQTITDITPNTNYKFSFWATQADVSLPIFEIHFIDNTGNDVLMDTQPQIPPFAGNWQWREYGIPLWNSGNNTNLTIRIVNLETNGMGNDFGLDDFALQQICSDTATISINVLADSLIYQQNVNCVGNGKIVLAGSGGLPPYQYQINGGAWQSSGIFSNLVAGTYTLQTKDANGCTIQRSIVIGTSTDAIQLNINQIQHLTCDALGSVVVGITDSTSIYYHYVLDSILVQSNGVFTGLSAGNHTVAVSNDFGCTTTITFTINDMVPPNCDDTNCLTTDTFNPATCLCEHAAILQPDCNDNDCNTADVYNFATCQCENNPISPTACDDGLCSTTDTYNTLTCLCEHTAIAEPNCDDDDCATTDSYNPSNCLCEHILTECLPLENILLIPNAFSPNGDEQNDQLRISGSNIATYSLYIYNRWGQKVFESHNITDTWDGKYKGAACPIGTYAYYFTGSFTNQEAVTQKGNITIVR